MAQSISRRQLLKTAAAGSLAAVAAPYIVGASARGAAATTAPSNRINMGCIGIGGMGGGHLNNLLGNAEVQVLAVCDVDSRRREPAKELVEQKYAGGTRGGTYRGCAMFTDFRDLLSRSDIDAVVIAVPDHWHVPIAMAAVRAGKDVYLEKPMSLTIAEGRRLCDTVARYGRIVQVGSQQRSTRNFRFACELVRNGRIGKLQSIRVAIPIGKVTGPQPEMPVPPGFDYEMWLGQAPWAPYTELRCHYNFRFVLDYSGGQMTNFGAHDLDIGQWGNGTDATGPIEVEGVGDFPNNGLYTTPSEVRVEWTYANSVKLYCTTGTSGVRFEGTDGWVYVNREKLDAGPKELLKESFTAGEVHLYESNSHWGNFLECVKTRRQPVAPVEIGHRTATVCHMGNLAMILGRKLRWDPQAERFVNDPEADRMMARAARAPWGV